MVYTVYIYTINNKLIEVGMKCFLWALIFCSTLAFGQKDRMAVVLDMTAINIETNSSRFISVNRMLRSSGIQYTTTSSLDTALLYPVIIMGSRIENGRFSALQIGQIINYVQAGGVIITSSMRETQLYNLCGINDVVSNTDVYRLSWDIGVEPDLFYMVNDSNEITVSLGDTSFTPNINFRSYNLTTATCLGKYEDNSCACTQNNYGLGRVYCFGPDFRDVYLRNQLDFDNEAQRTYSNGFEPSSDVFMFMVRNIVRKVIPNMVYKYSSFGKSSTAVMITHDIDSETGVDTMQFFSPWEQSNQIKAQYNITTRYFNDAWMTSFYVGSNSEVQQLLNDGHVLGSHSVGHFPDFFDETIFPYGVTGNTPTNYQPYYSLGITTGGTVLGELEVSKNLLEEDHGVNIRSFRSGHLVYPDSLAAAMMQLDYEFSSCNAGNNTLTQYPFYNFIERSFSSTESPVLEIPLTISDVFNSDPITPANYLQKVAIWTEVTRKFEENNAPVVLLIHPNRLYKFYAEQAYFDSLSNNVTIVNQEDFGDFWRNRDSLDFSTQVSNDTLFVFMNNANLHDEQSFVIDTTGISQVLFYDVNNSALAFNYRTFDAHSRLYYRDFNTSSIEPLANNNFSIFPNPSAGWLNLQLEENIGPANIQVYDINMRFIFSMPVGDQLNHVINLSEYLTTAGVYLIQIENEEYQMWHNFIYAP
jgi:hypothetical protein